MKTNEALRAILLQNENTITEAAKAASGDPALVFDTIYRAAVKVRQRYKKIANKERLADLCISYMKAPKKAGKVPFRSFEDCIDRAMGVWLFPTRPVLSAVAVILAAAIIIPVFLPKPVKTVNASGFVMEGTIARENVIKDSTIELKNLHSPGDLGVLSVSDIPDPRPESSRDFRTINHILNEAVTTSNGVTLYIVTYANAETKKGECIVYDAQTDGWHEAGRFDAAYFIHTMFINGQMEDLYYASRISTIADDEGNVYIMTFYRNGMQMHKYCADGTVKALDRIWLHDGETVKSSAGIDSSNNWTGNISAYRDATKNTIEIYMHSQIDIHRDGANWFLRFDMDSEKFDPNITESKHAALNNLSIMTYDGNGGFYVVTSTTLEGVTDKNGYDVEALALIHLKGDEILSTTPIGTGSYYLDRLESELLEMDGNDVEYIYRGNNGVYYMRFDEDGNIVDKYRIYAPSTDKISYLCFFRYEGDIYYLCYVAGTHLQLIQVQEDGYPLIVADFQNSGEFGYYFMWTKTHKTPLLSNGNILNLVAPGLINSLDPSVPDPSYFAQLVLNEASDASASENE